MVRTADNVLRVTGGKATRKGANATIRQDASLPKSPLVNLLERGTGGLNPICPRETPTWQKPITNFFQQIVKEKQSFKSLDTPNEQREEINEIEMSKAAEESTIETNSNHTNKDVDMTCSEPSGLKRHEREHSDEGVIPPKRFKLDKKQYMQLELLEK